jgi:hypothetical protein
MIDPLTRFRRSVNPQVGELVCGGRFAVTSVFGDKPGPSVRVSAVGPRGEVAFLQWRGYRWEVENL